MNKTLKAGKTIILLLFLSSVCFAGDIPDRKSSEIIYIDVGISQPDVEDCFTNYISEISGKEDLIIYPNPVSSLFTLQINNVEPNEKFTVRIYDITGNLVFRDRQSAKNENFSKQYSLPFLVNGVYIIQIITGSKSYTKQLIIY